jgi:hypothetical protein
MAGVRVRSNVHQGRAGESVHHGALGIDRRRVPGHRFPVGLCRSRGRGARSRAFDLASLSQGRGTGGPNVTPSRGMKNRP